MVKVLVCHIKDRGFNSRFFRMLNSYYNIFILLLISFILSSVLFGLSYSLSTLHTDSEKISSYECGFEPYEDAREQFEIRFYLVALFFLIFDLEAVFLFPWALALSEIHHFGFWLMIDFLIELLIGYIYIYSLGALDVN